MTANPIRHVSDTALWIAALRAQESLREDAIFRDPFAERLAGERGREIARRSSVHSSWALVSRTKIIDDEVLGAIARGADTVLSLAAGLDTRPYRLDLPETLSWVEIDLPDLVADKERSLASEQPRCRLRRLAADLTEPRARSQAFQTALEGSSSALVITEGLVMYLSPEQVTELAQELGSAPAVRSWVLDFFSPSIAELLRHTMPLDNAPLEFAPEEGVDFFERLGWRATKVHSQLKEAARLKRLPLWMQLLAWLPQPEPRAGRGSRRGGRWSVVVRLEHP